MASMLFGFRDMSVLVVGLLGLFGGATGLPLGIPPGPEDPLMAKVAPQKCLFYTTWAAVAKPETDAENHVEKLLAEPEVRRLLTEVERRLTAAAIEAAKTEGPATVEAVEDLCGWVKTLLTHSTAVFISSAKIGPAGLDVRGGLLVNVGQDAAKLKTSLQKHQALFMPGAAKPVTIAGNTWYRLKPDPSLPVLTWGTRGKYFIAGIGDGAIEEILARAYTAPPEWLTDLRKELHVDRIATVGYVDLKATVDALGPMMGGPMLQAALGAAGLGGAVSLGAVTGLDKEGFVSRTLLQLDGEPQGALRAVAGKPLLPADLAPIPHDATLAVAARIDAHAIFETFLSVMQKTDPRAHEYLLRDLQQMEAERGFNLRNELLKPLGDCWCLYASTSEGGLGVGGLTAVVPVKDRQPLAGVQAKILALAKRVMQPDEPAPPGTRRSQTSERIVQFEFAGQEVYFYTATHSPFAPSWCLTQKELIVAPFPQNIKAYLARGDEFKSLAAQPRVAALFESGDGPVMLSYFDTRPLFEWLYGSVQMLGQMATGEMWREGIDLDVSLLPSAKAIGKHLRPGVTAVRRTKSGIEMTSRQTFPGGNVATTVPIALAWTFPHLVDSPVAAGRAQSASNLMQIGRALTIHENTHRGFPPAYSTDPGGRPLLSWRVQILPYLEQKPLYDRFKLDEPWDSPHNRRLIASMPAVFRSPGSGAAPGETNYLTVRGENTAFPGKERITLDAISQQDGAADTIMVVEVSDPKAVIWTKPDDFKFDENNPAAGLTGPRKRGFNAVFCDGSVQLIRGNIDGNILKALFTRNGGEAFGRQDLSRPGEN